MTVIGSFPLDAIDRRLLRELYGSGRASMTDLARRVHVSRALAYTRVRRLLDGGVIRSFTVELSPAGLGLGTSAYVALTIQHNSWHEVRAALVEVPGVDHISLCSGEVDVLVLVRAADNATLRDLVLEVIRGIPGVLTTQTTIVLDEQRGAGLGSALVDPAPAQGPPVRRTRLDPVECRAG